MSITKQDLIKIAKHTWDEEEEMVESLISFIGDYNTCKEVMEKDLYFNRYESIGSWEELLYQLYDDPFLPDDYCEHMLNKSEEEMKSFLIKDNWALNIRHGIAIGFDDEINIINHEVV